MRVLESYLEGYGQSPLRGEESQMSVTARQPAKGEATFTVEIRPFTDHLAPDGKIIPLHCWDTAEIVIHRNASHGIAAASVIGHDLAGKTLTEILTMVDVTMHHWEGSARARELSAELLA